jgi:hypothetical protein
MTKKELNELIKEELASHVQGHPSFLKEKEDMEPGAEDEAGAEGEEEEDIMDSLKDFYEKLKSHFEGEEEGGEEAGGEEELDEAVPEEEEEPKKEIALNESIKRFQKLANIRG